MRGATSKLSAASHSHSYLTQILMEFQGRVSTVPPGRWQEWISDFLTCGMPYSSTLRLESCHAILGLLHDARGLLSRSVVSSWALSAGDFGSCLTRWQHHHISPAFTSSAAYCRTRQVLLCGTDAFVSPIAILLLLLVPSSPSPLSALPTLSLLSWVLLLTSATPHYRTVVVSVSRVLLCLSSGLSGPCGGSAQGFRNVQTSQLWADLRRQVEQLRRSIASHQYTKACGHAQLIKPLRSIRCCAPSAPQVSFPIDPNGSRGRGFATEYLVADGDCDDCFIEVALRSGVGGSRWLSRAIDALRRGVLVDLRRSPQGEGRERDRDGYDGVSATSPPSPSLISGHQFARSCASWVSPGGPLDSVDALLRVCVSPPAPLVTNCTRAVVDCPLPHIAKFVPPAHRRACSVGCLRFANLARPFRRGVARRSRREAHDQLSDVYTRTSSRGHGSPSLRRAHSTGGWVRLRRCRCKASWGADELCGETRLHSCWRCSMDDLIGGGVLACALDGGAVATDGEDVDGTDMGGRDKEVLTLFSMRFGMSSVRGLCGKCRTVRYIRRPPPWPTSSYGELFDIRSICERGMAVLLGSLEVVATISSTSVCWLAGQHRSCAPVGRDLNAEHGVAVSLAAAAAVEVKVRRVARGVSNVLPPHVASRLMDAVRGGATTRNVFRGMIEAGSCPILRTPAQRERSHFADVASASLATLVESFLLCGDSTALLDEPAGWVTGARVWGTRRPRGGAVGGGDPLTLPPDLISLVSDGVHALFDNVTVTLRDLVDSVFAETFDAAAHTDLSFAQRAVDNASKDRSSRERSLSNVAGALRVAALWGVSAANDRRLVDHALAVGTPTADGGGRTANSALRSAGTVSVQSCEPYAVAVHMTSKASHAVKLCRQWALIREGRREVATVGWRGGMCRVVSNLLRRSVERCACGAPAVSGQFEGADCHACVGYKDVEGTAFVGASFSVVGWLGGRLRLLRNGKASSMTAEHFAASFSNQVRHPISPYQSPSGRASTFDREVSIFEDLSVVEGTFTPTLCDSCVTATVALSSPPRTNGLCSVCEAPLHSTPLLLPLSCFVVLKDLVTASTLTLAGVGGCSIGDVARRLLDTSSLPSTGFWIRAVSVAILRVGVAMRHTSATIGVRCQPLVYVRVKASPSFEECSCVSVLSDAVCTASAPSHILTLNPSWVGTRSFDGWEAPLPASVWSRSLTVASHIPSPAVEGTVEPQGGGGVTFSSTQAGCASVCGSLARDALVWDACQLIKGASSECLSLEWLAWQTAVLAAARGAHDITHQCTLDELQALHLQWLVSMVEVGRTLMRDAHDPSLVRLSP